LVWMLAGTGGARRTTRKRSRHKEAGQRHHTEHGHALSLELTRIARRRIKRSPKA
jgi:hypothetical protein